MEQNLKKNGNMLNHITNILEIIDKLSGMEENVSISRISSILLCCLPASYNTLALEAQPEDKLTSDFIKNKLTDKYSKRLENLE